MIISLSRGTSYLHIAFLISSVSSFVLGPGVVHGGLRHGRPTAPARGAASEDDASSNTETLTFSCDYTHLSEPIPNESKEELAAYLRQNEAKSLLISVGGKRPARTCDLTPELLSLWKESCDVFYGDASLPEDGDEVIACESVINFPGLKYTSVIYSGTKLVHGGDGFPVHEFVLIAEQQRVEGPAPLVWVYRKLTGAENDPEGSINRSKGFARSRVFVLDKVDHCALAFDVNVQIRVDFPKIFVRIMPFPKEKMEEQGSASVLKALTKDIIDAVDITRNSFLKLSATEMSVEA